MYKIFFSVKIIFERWEAMKSFKSQTRKIYEVFISLSVIIASAMLVASGLAVSKINTEYMESGVKAAKIIAQRENEEIFVSLNGRKFAPPQEIDEYIETAAMLLPAPLNVVYYFCNEIAAFINK